MNNFITWDFAGMIIFLFAILFLLWGNETLREGGYLKFISSLKSFNYAFVYTVLSRIIIAILVILFLFAAMYAVVLLKGFTFSSAELFPLVGYILKVILISLFFFSIGIFTGLIRSKHVGIIASFVTWVVCVMVIPGIVKYHTAQKANAIASEYQVEFDKVKDLVKFEDVAKKEFGSDFNRNNMELARKIMENFFWKEYYPKVAGVEEKLKDGIIEHIDRYEKISVVFPTIFYYTGCSEIGSIGYKNFIEFYSKDKLDLKFKKREFRTWAAESKHLVNLLYNLFSGKNKKVKDKGLPVRVSVDDVDITMEKTKDSFLYLCSIENIPGEIKAGDLIRFFSRMMKAAKEKRREILELPEIKPLIGKRFHELENMEKVEILLTLTKISKKNIYLVHDLAPYFTIKYSIRFKERMTALSNEGALVIFLSSSYYSLIKPDHAMIFFAGFQRNLM